MEKFGYTPLASQEDSFNYISIFPSIIKETSNNKKLSYILEAVVTREGIIEQDKKKTRCMVSIQNTNKIHFHPITILRIYEQKSQIVTFSLFELSKDSSNYSLVGMATTSVHSLGMLDPIELNILDDNKIQVEQVILKSIQRKNLKKNVASFSLTMCMYLTQDYPIQNASIILIGKSNVHLNQEIEIIEGEQLMLIQEEKQVNILYQVQDMAIKYLFAKSKKSEDNNFKIKIILRGDRQEGIYKMQGEYCFTVRKDDFNESGTIEVTNDQLIKVDHIQNSFTLFKLTYEISNLSIQKDLTLNHYMKSSSVNFNFIVGIDFSYSSKDEHNISLESIKDNLFVQSITKLGGIILQICSSKEVEVNGFSGIPQLPHFKEQSISHCFPIIGYETYPKVTDIMGILSAYFNILDKNQIQLGQNTKLCPLINQASMTAQTGKSQSLRNYYILLIITDGVSQDMLKAIDLIRTCQDLPISFIIAGVGVSKESLEDMEGMELLNNLKKYNADRDMIIFINMNDFNQDTERKIMLKFEQQVVKYYEDNPINQAKSNNLLQNKINRQGVEEYEKAQYYKQQILSEQIQRIKEAMMPPSIRKQNLVNNT